MSGGLGGWGTCYSFGALGAFVPPGDHGGALVSQYITPRGGSSGRCVPLWCLCMWPGSILARVFIDGSGAANLSADLSRAFSFSFSSSLELPLFLSLSLALSLALSLSRSLALSLSLSLSRARARALSLSL